MTPVIPFPEPRHVAIDRVLGEHVTVNIGEALDDHAPDEDVVTLKHMLRVNRADYVNGLDLEDAPPDEPAPARTTADAIRDIMEME